MLLLKIAGMQLKYELNELAITSGSLMMMPFRLIGVLDDLWCFHQEWRLCLATLSYCF